MHMHMHMTLVNHPTPTFHIHTYVRACMSSPSDNTFSLVHTQTYLGTIGSVDRVQALHRSESSCILKLLYHVETADPPCNDDEASVLGVS